MQQLLAARPLVAEEEVRSAVLSLEDVNTPTQRGVWNPAKGWEIQSMYIV